jgi:GT2 family glycosyltransferase
MDSESFSQDLEVSLVIPTYNTCEVVIDCVNSILENIVGLQCEVIVVDDASSDGTYDRLKELFPKIRIIHNSVSLGYGGAANRGMKIARGRYVAVSNSDILLREGAAARLVKFLEMHPGAAAVGPKLLNNDGSLQKSISRYPSIGADLVSLLIPRNLLEFPPVLSILRVITSLIGINLGRLGDEPCHPVEVDCLMGAFFIVRRDVIEQTGGFDAENFYMLKEEADWFKRIRKAGWAVYYIPKAEVIHHGSATVKVFNHRYQIQRYKSLLTYYEKHYGIRTGILYRILLTPIFCSKAVFYWALALLPSKRRSDYLGFWELYITLIRIFYDSRLRNKNVLHDLHFRYL